MSPHPHDPPMAADTVYLGLYLDAETTGAGTAHERLGALALLPFTFDSEDWSIRPLVEEALDCPDLHRPAAAAADPRAPGIDLARACALVERAHLVVTHTRGFSRALLDRLVPPLGEVPWLEWQLGVLDFDGVVRFPDAESRGLGACKSGLWLVSRADSGFDRPVLARLLAQSAPVTHAYLQ